MCTVRAALDQARLAGVARLDAQLLLGHLLGRPREWLLAHDEEALPEACKAAWPALLARRAAGEPLAYLTGEREFCGLRLAVSPAVLVPRPETEGLVQWALECLAALPPEARVVDLGTGSGAIALAVKQARPAALVSASDASLAAMAIARGNAARLELVVEFSAGDWWSAWPGRRFDLALSNPPYIADGDSHLPALAHEPQQALTSGKDGLDALRRIVDDAALHLATGAWLLLEHGHDQAPAVRQLLSARGFEQARTRVDLADLPRFTGAVWPGPLPAAQ